MYYLGLDVGTSSLKCLAVDSELNIVFEINKSYPLLTPKSLYFEQNPMEWVNALNAIFKEIPNEIKQNLEAISFGGQMHGLVMLDKMDILLDNAILWNDQRNYQEVEYLNTIYGKEKLLSQTSNFALTGFTLPKLLWVKNHKKDLYSRIDKIMLPKDYLVYYLTKKHVTDYSDASGMLMLDVKNKCWQKDLLNALDIQIDILPELHNSSDIIDLINEQIALEHGINSKCKIVMGGSDQSVAAIGSGALNKNDIILSLGTSGVIYANLENYTLDITGSLHLFCNANYGYHFMGVMLSAAQSLKWLCENIYYENDIQKIVDEVVINDNHFVYFNPYLSGERTPLNDPFATACFYGLEMKHTRKDMTRAVLEGVAFAFKDILNIIEKNGLNIKKCRVNGGGTQSETWLEIIASVLNIELEIVNTKDAVAFGACILALNANKKIGRIEKIAVNRIVKPKFHLTNYYETKYNIFKQIYPNLKNIKEE